MPQQTQERSRDVINADANAPEVQINRDNLHRGTALEVTCSGLALGCISRKLSTEGMRIQDLQHSRRGGVTLEAYDEMMKAGEAIIAAVPGIVPLTIRNPRQRNRFASAEYTTVVEFEGGLARVLQNECMSCYQCGTFWLLGHDPSGAIRPQTTTMRGDGVFCSPKCAEEYGFSQDENGTWLSPRHRLANAGLRSYDEANRSIHPAKFDNPFRIGFEVEKEDVKWIHRGSLDSYAGRWGWIAVSDGSLNDGAGFELVSPAYNMKEIDKFNELWKEFEALDANVSVRCGGHINVSQHALTPDQVIYAMRDFIPLLYAMYPKRLSNRWCKVTKSCDTLAGGDKYRAVNVRDNRVEFRLFSRVKNRKQLVWRAKLLHYGIDADRRGKVLTDLRTPGSWLRRHLRQVYTEKELQRRHVLYHHFNEWYRRDPSADPSNVVKQFLPEKYSSTHWSSR